MKGPGKMWSGQGEKEYRQENRRFSSLIPDDFPDWMSVEERAKNHPAYCNNEFANKRQGFDYRRAHFGGKGPQGKAEHAAFAECQGAHDEYGNLIQAETSRRSVLAWLLELLVP